ncbi:MAG: hypothetical protein RLZZ490_1437 [Cyanobacteriota bacterium]
MTMRSPKIYPRLLRRCLRFQIEFNVRDTEQFWGLEDFMNTSETRVTNAANLFFFMVNVSHRLLGDFRVDNPWLGVLDLFESHLPGLQVVLRKS